MLGIVSSLTLASLLSLINNLEKISAGTSRNIAAYSIINNAGEITLENGYTRTAQYYDKDDKEYRKFVITPLITNNLPPDLRAAGQNLFEAIADDINVFVDQTITKELKSITTSTDIKVTTWV